MTTNPEASPNESTAFPPTIWTQVMKMRESADPEANRAVLDRLCQSYWQPLFQYARRLGNSREHAQDLTQGFFLYVLKSGLFGKADQERGKLRTLLLTSFGRYIHGEYDKATAGIRGGVEGTLSLDAFEEAESNYQAEGDESASPEFTYDKRCAVETLAKVMAELATQCAKVGKLAHFESLRQFIVASGNEESYGVEAAKLGVRGDYYKVMVQRFRQQFKAVCFSVIRETMPEDATEAEIQQEVWEIIRLAYS